MAALKLIVNQAYENMGLSSTQILGPILNGLMRNTPDAINYIRRAEQDGGRFEFVERYGAVNETDVGASGHASTRVRRSCSANTSLWASAGS